MDSPGKSLKGKSPINNKQEKEEKEEKFSMHSFIKKTHQAMDSPGKLFTLKNPVQAPINKKPEKEDGFPTPEGEPFSLQLYVKKNLENQAMDSPGKLFTVKVPVQAPEKEEDGLCELTHTREKEKRKMDSPLQRECNLGFYRMLIVLRLLHAAESNKRPLENVGKDPAHGGLPPSTFKI
ncbi:unnamed protein product [Brassica oleracea]